MSGSAAGAPALWRHPEFGRGARELVGIAVGIAAWGVVAGVAMADSPGTGWAVVLSLVMFSGTGQLASLPLIHVTFVRRFPHPEPAPERSRPRS